MDKNVAGIINAEYIIKQLYKSVNMLIADFGTSSSDTLLTLVMYYCTSLYGITLIDITSASFTKVEIAWRKLYVWYKGTYSVP